MYTEEHELEYEVCRNDDYIPVTLVYTLSTYYPAQTYGPPEDCYPAEGGEIEDLEAYDENGKPFPLTDDEEIKAQAFIYDRHIYNDY